MTRAEGCAPGLRHPGYPRPSDTPSPGEGVNQKLLRVCGVLLLSAGFGLSAVGFFGNRTTPLSTGGLFVSLGILFLALSFMKSGA